MTETQKRIEAYQNLLPGIREKVTAVALLLALSVIMLTSASFAWLTISRAPEVTAVSTNIAANGNLEIALAEGDGTEHPKESKVGDSMAKKAIVDANITWGNLINLGDPSYGLDHLVLRPAVLDKDHLSTRPLYGAVYAIDGRIEKPDTNFGYSKWNKNEDETLAKFEDSKEFGVRAISSMQTSIDNAVVELAAYISKIEEANIRARTLYMDLTGNETYMEALAFFMGTYMTDRMNQNDNAEYDFNNPVIKDTDLEPLVNMYGAFKDIMAEEAEALAQILNLQLYLKNNSTKFTHYSGSDIINLETDDLKNRGLSITEFESFKTDYNIVYNGYDSLKALLDQSGAGVYWRGDPNYDGTSDKEKNKYADGCIKKIIDEFITIGTCKVIGPDDAEYTVNGIGATQAYNYNGKSCYVIITNGVLKNFEQRSGARMDVGKEYGKGKGLPVNASGKRYGVKMDGTIYANITTSATGKSQISLDIDSSTEGKELRGDSVAKDTYGMALDFWIRTNSDYSFLTLEGNVIADELQVDVYTTDGEGNSYLLYTLDRSGSREVEDENGNNKTEEYTETFEIYKIESNGGTKWYYADSTDEFTLNSGETPKQKKDTVLDVKGYEGENRVWNDSMLSTDATTQGNGSCYVFYTEKPEDQEKFLKLLDAFKVAFVDADGNYLAGAEMDTAKSFKDIGRVTVPLVLSEADALEIINEEGEKEYAITRLAKNTPTRITAIVYLDADMLDNGDVLAAANVEGQLNIQFGNSTTLVPIDNETLEVSTRTVTATVTAPEGGFDYDDPDQGAMISTVTVNISGTAEQPDKVEAFFIRKINETQGSPEPKMPEFTQSGEGEWTSQYEFTAPGVYVLRTVIIDGQEYRLDKAPQVTVKGFGIKSLSYIGAESSKNIDIMSAGNSGTAKIKLEFASDNPSKRPEKVRGVFVEGDKVSNVTFKYDVTEKAWFGTANFTSSGEYSMDYIDIDGKYIYLNDAMKLKASITLGLTVSIYTTGDQVFEYDRNEIAHNPNRELLRMQVIIKDNAGNELVGLKNVHLYYSPQGSEKQMHTEMTWNSSEGYYEGALKTLESGGPGVWQFLKIVVEGNDITTAPNAPVFRIMPSDPPEYVSHFVPEFYMNMDGNASVSVDIDYSSTAEVMAIFVKDGTEYFAPSEPEPQTTGDTTTWVFKVPKGSSNTQDGTWTLVDVYVWEFSDEDGNYITTDYNKETGLLPKDFDRDAIMRVDLNGNNKTIKVIDTISVSFAKDKSENFGDKESTEFMTEHKISGLSVDIKDGDNKKVTDQNGNAMISDVKLTFIYDSGTSTSYGGYSSMDTAVTETKIVVPLEVDSTGTHFEQEEDVPIIYAGKYTTELSFRVGSTTHTYTSDGENTDANKKNLPHNGPVFTVSSKAPSVAITAAKFASATNGGNVTITSGASTTVYFHKTTNTTCGITTTNYTSPTVTITLSDMGKATGVSLKFITTDNNGTVYLYRSGGSGKDNTDQVDTFTWSAAGACLRYIGKYDYQSGGNDSRTAARTLTANELILTYPIDGKDVSFKVSIPTITISNPS